MGLQINKELIQSNGLIIPSGSVVTWNTMFIGGSLYIRFAPVNLFLNVTDRNNYYNNVEGSTSPINSATIINFLPYYDFLMTLEQFENLNNKVGVMNDVEGYLLDSIVNNSNGYLLNSDITIIPSFIPTP
jgi:hypothetical protein